MMSTNDGGNNNSKGNNGSNKNASSDDIYAEITSYDEFYSRLMSLHLPDEGQEPDYPSPPIYFQTAPTNPAPTDMIRIVCEDKGFESVEYHCGSCKYAFLGVIYNDREKHKKIAHGFYGVIDNSNIYDDTTILRLQCKNCASPIKIDNSTDPPLIYLMDNMRDDMYPFMPSRQLCALIDYMNNNEGILEKVMDTIEKKDRPTGAKTMQEYIDKSKCRINRIKTSPYFEGGRFVPKMLADDIMCDESIITIDGDDMRIYEDGIYCAGGEESIKEIATRKLSAETTTHYINETVNYIKNTTYKSSTVINTDKEHINLLNGVLDTGTMRLESHSPRHLHTIRIPINYNPSATCPRIDKFLGEVVNEEYMETIYEFFGYCLYRSLPIHKAFMLVGEGANGKSTLLNLLRAFLGKGSYMAIALQRMEDSRFSTSALYGKLANICNELSSDALRGTGAFKALTGRDGVDAERKFGHQFTYDNYAKLIFACNRIPLTKDDTIAFFRRWVIIPFVNTFPDGVADKYMIDKLTTQEELSGLLNKSLFHLQKLLERGMFTRSESPDELRERYIRLSDSVGAFVMDCVETDSEGWVLKKALYNAYIEYCKTMNYPIMSDGVFHKRLPKHMNVIQYTPEIDGKRITAWRGIRMRDSADGTPKDAAIQPPPEKRRDWEYRIDLYDK